MGDNWVYQNPVNGDWKDGYTGKTINSSPPSAFAGDGKEWTYTESCGWQPVPQKTSSSSSRSISSYHDKEEEGPLVLLFVIIFLFLMFIKILCSILSMIN